MPVRMAPARAVSAKGRARRPHLRAEGCSKVPLAGFKQWARYPLQKERPRLATGAHQFVVLNIRPFLSMCCGSPGTHRRPFYAV
jgi:hypothetical protein